MVKNNFNLRNYLILFFGFSIHTAFAQSSISLEQFAQLSAFESFQARRYQSVIVDLQAKDRSKDEEILYILSQLKTGKERAESAEEWLNENPNHPIKPFVYYHLGEYYFYEKDTIKSNRYLSSVSATDLPKKDKASYGYLAGLQKLDKGKFADAQKLFQFSRNNDFDTPEKLDYYQGFTSYHLGDQDQALAYLNKVGDSERFGNSAKFFIAKIRLDAGEIDQVLTLAQTELSDEKSVTNSGFYQLIGEAYARKEEVAKADAFFERAIELHPGRPSAALFYQAGVAKFKIGNEGLAIQFLTESGLQGGEYAQLSAFQLGRLYLKENEYEKALSAYIEASTSSDEVIKEESLYQAASINARLEIFDQAIKYAIDYLKNYKDSKKSEYMQNLIAQSYLRTSNYDLAIEHLTNTGISNTTQKQVYQKVTYQKAILSFNDANFSEAQKWFTESLKYAIDVTLSNSSYFHLAEISMRAGSFNQAIKQYKNQSTLDANSNYGIGYAYYNTEQYGKAIPYFRKARLSTVGNIKDDASVRLADCLYATKSYQEAYDIYNGLSKRIDSDYLTYQKGIALKDLGKGNEAIITFKSIANNSRYSAKAIYQSGMIEFESANFISAESYFSQVIEKHPTSSFKVNALLNRGISMKNQGQLKNAQSDYVNILENHIESDIAFNAILGLQELEQSGLETRKLKSYIETYKKAHPDDGSLELIEFEAAKQLYFSFSYLPAAQAFDKFLKDYPASGNKMEAKYYKADSYYRGDDFVEAKSAFDELKFVRNPFTGRILNRLGEINKYLNNTKESEEAYNLLISLDLTPKDTYNGLQGLMLLYFDVQQYENAINIGDKIIALEWKPLNAEQQAMLTKAKSLFELDELPLAQENFLLLKTSEGAIGAESNYLLGLIAYKNEEYEKSLDILFDLNTNYGSYSMWVDKSYLLIAKNYIGLKELFQAKATLRSIIQYAKNEDIIAESRILLTEIEQADAVGDSTQIKD